MKLSTSRNSQKAFFTLDRPLFYYITDRRQLTGTSLDTCIRRALKWGVDFIQIREKDLPDRSLFELIQRVVDLAHGTQCRILLNGRADIALAAKAHGVHLPSNSLRVSEIRSWLPDTFIVGMSGHSEKEIQSAGSDGADYVLLGHLFPTPSKSAYGHPVGLDYLHKVCATASIPVFGLGGIHTDRIDSVYKSGAIGIAGISLFQKSDQFKSLKNLYNPL